MLLLHCYCYCYYCSPRATWRRPMRCGRRCLPCRDLHGHQANNPALLRCPRVLPRAAVFPVAKGTQVIKRKGMISMYGAGSTRGLRLRLRLRVLGCMLPCWRSKPRRACAPPMHCARRLQMSAGCSVRVQDARAYRCERCHVASCALRVPTLLQPTSAVEQHLHHVHVTMRCCEVQRGAFSMR